MVNVMKILNLITDFFHMQVESFSNKCKKEKLLTEFTPNYCPPWFLISII